MRAVARYADICNIGFEMDHGDYGAKLAKLNEHCRLVGRDPSEIEVSHNTRVFIAQDSDGVEELVCQQAAKAGTTPKAFRQSLRGAIAGTPEECRDQIQSLVDRRLTYFFLLFPEPVQVDALNLFAEKVMPYFLS